MIPENRELEITPGYFEELIVNYKKNESEFCSLDDIDKSKLSHFRFWFQKKFVNVSFDDGFQDVYTNAYPILKKYNIPFTIYLTTDFPDNKAMIWWIILENIVMQNDEVRLDTGEKYSCRNLNEKIEFYALMAKRIFTSENKPLDTFKSLFKNYLNIFDNINDNLTMSWEQLTEMSESGLCTIGSHSVTHPDMRKITETDLQYELEESMRIIKSRIKKEVLHFSYPHSFRNQEVEDALKRTGFRTAVMGYGGSIRWHDNRFKLPRKYIVQP
jgi:peptidoglycan/xylan/chitin deacetylase (PgdA/CDA1 family)